MTSSLDELFSPEKLRQNWQQSPTPVIVPKDSSNQAIHANYQELQQLITNRFSDAKRLTGCFDELTLKINQTFPLTVTHVMADDSQKQEIVGLLEDLEELLWAMGLSQGGV